MKAFYTLLLVLGTAVCLAGCGKSSNADGSRTNATQAAAGLPALKQAVQTYNTQEGHFPKALDDLVPKYIAKIPDAPGGYKFVYDPATGIVTQTRN